MAKAPEPRIGLVAALDAFVAAAGGETFDVRKGDLLEVDHPLVAAYPHLFGPPRLRFPVARGTRVETATAAPGEKRGA